MARIRKLIDREKHGTQKRVGLEALLQRRLAEGSDESGGGGEDMYAIDLETITLQSISNPCYHVIRTL